MRALYLKTENQIKFENMAIFAFLVADLTFAVVLADYICQHLH